MLFTVCGSSRDFGLPKIVFSIFFSKVGLYIAESYSLPSLYWGEWLNLPFWKLLIDCEYYSFEPLPFILFVNKAIWLLEFLLMGDTCWVFGIILCDEILILFWYLLGGYKETFFVNNSSTYLELLQNSVSFDFDVINLL